jgi:hypothetical protein
MPRLILRSPHITAPALCRRLRLRLRLLRRLLRRFKAARFRFPQQLHAAIWGLGRQLKAALGIELVANIQCHCHPCSLRLVEGRSARNGSARGTCGVRNCGLWHCSGGSSSGWLRIWHHRFEVLAAGAIARVNMMLVVLMMLLM